MIKNKLAIISLIKQPHKKKTVKKIVFSLGETISMCEDYRRYISPVSVVFPSKLTQAGELRVYDIKYLVLAFTWKVF